jgi:competence protein ComEC
VLAAQPDAGLLTSVEPGHPLMALRPWRRCLAGQRWDWDGVAFEVLHPVLDDYRLRLKPNALSCVLRITGRGATALLAGDLEAPQERRLVEGGVALAADLLLVPHHGSRTSSSEAFLEAVRPRLALVQAGYRNRYGHPAPLVMARYARRGIEVVASPACGAARWASGQPGPVICERREARRYWHHQASPAPATAD